MNRDYDDPADLPEPRIEDEDRAYDDAVQREIDAMKFCRDCKHLKLTEGSGIAYADCARTSRINVVSGESEVTSCATERVMEGEHWCGPDARFFELRVKVVA